MFDTSLPGPYYEDFVVGAAIPLLPPVTLSDADNVVYRAATGDQHPLAASAVAYAAAAGGAGRLANPGMVMQYAIGQTTMATRQVIANLYYRGVRVLRPVELGETLTATATVLGLKDSAPKGDQRRGKVWLGVRTATDTGPVVEYERCALVRARAANPPGHNVEIPGPSEPTPLSELSALAPSWDLSGLPTTTWNVGEVRTDPLRDHIDMAAPLARLTFNQAAVHRDWTATTSGERLVYGGHVQGLAQASLTRMLPGMAHVVAWDGCDHMAPAHEGDLLRFTHRLVERMPAGSGHLLRFAVTGERHATPSSDTNPWLEVLRWTPVVWAA